MERAASGDDVSPSQQQLQLVTKPTAAGSVNPMEDMQSWQLNQPGLHTACRLRCLRH